MSRAGIVSLVAVMVMMWIAAFTLLITTTNAQSRRPWTYECFATFGSAVNKLNSLSEDDANNAKVVGYDTGLLSHCVVFRK